MTFESAAPSPKSEVRWAADLVTDLYDRCWFSIVTETEMTTRAIRITEKPLKPLANFHPFLIFGNPGSLAFLKQLGFSTFAPWIDERYDDEPDPLERFDLAYAEVRRISAMPNRSCTRLREICAKRLSPTPGTA